LNGLITGDQVNLNAQGQFADKNAGSNKNVNVSGNLSGTDAGNYSFKPIVNTSQHQQETNYRQHHRSRQSLRWYNQCDCKW
jgi:hypothetical protein